MRSLPTFRRLLVVAFVLLAAASAARAQTTIDVNAASYTVNGGVTTYNFAPLQVAGSGGSLFLSDSRADQQTGQYGDDFVGGSTSNPGFMMQYGQINGVDYVAFRLRYNEYNPTSYDNNAKTRLGMDGDGDGDIDLFFGVDFHNNSAPTIGFQAPGTGLNVSPSTTSIGNNFIPTFEAGESSLAQSYLTLQDGVTFSYMQVTEANTPGFTNFASGKAGTPDADAYMTFAVPFLYLQEALQDLSGVNITPSSFVRFIAFTSTQNNSINQDIFGSNGISGSVRFDAPGGGFTEYTDATGSPVPEPATYAQVGTLLGIGGFLWLKRRRQTRQVATQAV
ncbi:MAG TPA: PEP-CTERM sorting domain-containing protein [Opitutaceae bacterium]